MQENKLYVSETKFFERGDTIALLDINSGRVFKIDEPTKQLITEIKENGVVENNDNETTTEIIDELKSVKLISDQKIKTIFVKPENDDDIKEIRVLDLLISQDCNMACTYCFAEEGAYRGDNKGLMSWEIAKSLLTF